MKINDPNIGVGKGLIMFNFRFGAIAALALPVMTGCVNTESVTVKGPNGEETMKRTDSLIASDRTVTITNDQAYRDCLSLNAPTMGSSYADMYCRSVTAPGSSFYQPAGPYMMRGGMPFGGAVYPFPAGHGVHEYAGSIADPIQAGYAVANARADATYPETAKNPQDFARRSELHTVVRQTRRLGNALGETRANLRDHKKGASK